MAAKRWPTVASRAGGVGGTSAGHAALIVSAACAAADCKALQLGALRLVGPHHAIDLIGRPRHHASIALATNGRSGEIALRGLAVGRRTRGDVVEPRFLLVAERIVEGRQRRIDGIDRIDQRAETIVHLRKPSGRRERDIALAMRSDLVAGFDNGIAEIVAHLALPLIGRHRGLDLIDRPAGDFAGFLVTALHHALSEPRHALRRAWSLHVIVAAVREKDGLVDVAVAVGPERIVPPVIPRPQREVEEVALGVGPEQGTDPADMEEVIMVPPVVVPTLAPERVECGLIGEVTP